MREAGVSATALPFTEPWGDVDILLNRKLSLSCLLSWKLVLIIEKFSPGASNLITARRTNPTWLIFRLQNGKTKIFLNFLHKVSIKRFSVALREQEDCLVLLTYEEYPHILQIIIRWADLFWLWTSFSQLFPCWSSLTRHAFNKHLTPRVRVSLFDSFWLKPITQAAIYIPNIIGQIYLVWKQRW